MKSTQQFEEGITLDRYLMDTLSAFPDAQGSFVNLMQSIALAGKMISARVNRAGLAGMVGATGGTNIQGEFVQKLDVYANETFQRALEHRGHTCMVISEEEGGAVRVPAHWHSGRYVVAVDPLDGSSNIDVSVTIGTIFGIWRRRSPEGTRAVDSDALQAGHQMIAAGYILYGAGTVLVLATEIGVQAFQLDPVVGEFFLTHPDIKLPTKSPYYSCNSGYWSDWPEAVHRSIEAWRSEGMGARYVGSLVADFHRNLLKGGVFLYPATSAHPQGKLRLLYEAFPLAYIVERAGGRATDGGGRILDRIPTSLHERTPLFIGNRREVEQVSQALLRQPVS